MNNTVEFKLTLKDVMSGALQKVANTAQSAFKKVDASTENTKKKIASLGQPVSINVNSSSVKNAMRDVENLNSSIDKVGRKLTTGRGGMYLSPTAGSIMQGGGGGRFGGFGRGLVGLLRPGLGGMIAGLGAGTAISAGIASATRAGIEGEAQLQSFQVLAGNAAGGKLYKDLTKFAQESIFGNEVYKNAQTQLAFGAKAGDVMQNSKMLGDISMGNKERLGALNLAFSQSMASGKLQGQDLNQFVNAGFNPLQEMSRTSGKSMAELRKEMEKGNITFGMVAASIKSATSEGGKFYQMTERMAKTTFGKVQKMYGDIDNIRLEAGRVFAPLVSEVIDKFVSPALDKISTNIAPFAKELVNDFRAVAPTIKDIFNGMGNALKPFLKLATSPEMKEFGQNLLYTTKSLVDNLAPAADAAAKNIKVLAQAINPILQMADKLAHPFKNFDDKKALIYAAQQTSLTMRGSMSANLQNILPGTYAQIYGGKSVNKVGGIAGQLQGVVIPGATTPGGKAAGGALAMADAYSSLGSTAATENITGGGRKVVNININRSPFEIQTMNVSSSGNQIGGTDIKQLERLFGEWLRRQLDSASYDI